MGVVQSRPLIRLRRGDSLLIPRDKARRPAHHLKDVLLTLMLADRHHKATVRVQDQDLGPVHLNGQCRWAHNTASRSLATWALLRHTEMQVHQQGLSTQMTYSIPMAMIRGLLVSTLTVDRLASAWVQPRQPDPRATTDRMVVKDLVVNANALAL